jgi:uncharacterized protein (TIGR02996 family)
VLRRDLPHKGGGQNPKSRECDVSAVDPEYLTLLKAVCAAPDDDTPRLVVADWLQEHDNGDRAAFIRVQVELARLEATGQGQTPAAEALRKREYASLGPRSTLRPLWAMEDAPGLVRWQGSLGGFSVDGADRVGYRRGFVEKVTSPAAEWRHHAAVIRDRQPLREVLLTGCDRMTRDDWYKALPALRGLPRVVLADAEPETIAWLRQFLPGTAVAHLV